MQYKIGGGAGVGGMLLNASSALCKQLFLHLKPSF